MTRTKQEIAQARRRQERMFGWVLVAVIGSMVLGAWLMGQADRTRSAIEVHNGCATSVDVVIWDSGRPQAESPVRETVPLGGVSESRSFHADVVFQILVIGPTGGEYRTEVTYEGEIPEPTVVTISGSACPD